MKRLPVVWLGVVALLVLPNSTIFAQQHSVLTERFATHDVDSIVNPPHVWEKDECGESEDDEESDELSDVTKGCSIRKAMVDPDGPSTLILEGSFCEEPTVFAGASGGTLEPLQVIASGPTFIEANLAPWTDPATRVVVVECPCAACAMDVTIGIVGPSGPAGPAGAPGPPGELPQALPLDRNFTVRTSTGTVGEGIWCHDASCLPGEVATGGGFSAWVPSTDGLDPAELVNGFAVASQGPYLPGDVVSGVVPTTLLAVAPPSRDWKVCGVGSGMLLTVYAICMNTTIPICGDGELVAPEVCEMDADCAAFGSHAECTDCNCTNYCGDGVITPPEQCEPTSLDSCGPLEDCSSSCRCVPAYPDDEDVPGGGDS